jgi:hypothetical protein
LTREEEKLMMMKGELPLMMKLLMKMNGGPMTKLQGGLVTIVGGGNDNGRDIGDGDQEVTDDKEGVGLDEVGCADDDSDPDKGGARNDGKAGVVGGFESKGDVA